MGLRTLDDDLNAGVLMSIRVALSISISTSSLDLPVSYAPHPEYAESVDQFALQFFESMPTLTQNRSHI
jgi:hypothetical protein